MSKECEYWGKEGLLKTVSFIKKHRIHWKKVIPAVKVRIILADNEFDLDYWLNSLLRVR